MAALVLASMMCISRASVGGNGTYLPAHGRYEYGKYL
jgi:hypothetical protein